MRVLVLVVYTRDIPARGGQVPREREARSVEGDFEAIGGGMGVLIEPVSPDDDPEFEEFMVQDILLPRTFVESLLK